MKQIQVGGLGLASRLASVVVRAGGGQCPGIAPVAGDPQASRHWITRSFPGSSQLP